MYSIQQGLSLDLLSTGTFSTRWSSLRMPANSQLEQTEMFQTVNAGHAVQSSSRTAAKDQLTANSAKAQMHAASQRLSPFLFTH